MADSTLDYTGEEPPETGKGHGVGSLGPSDSSDSGSDIAGAQGLRDDIDPGLDRGTSADPGGDGTDTAGPDIGDGNLDSDSDASGTGERAAAGRDAARSDRDISVDRVIPVGSDPRAADPRENVDDAADSAALADADAFGDAEALEESGEGDDEAPFSRDGRDEGEGESPRAGRSAKQARRRP